MKRLLDSIADGLRIQGFTRLSGTMPGTIAEFSKAMRGMLFLTIGIERSRLRPRWITSSFYLSQTCCWGYVLPGFPDAAFQRIGHFLKPEERRSLLSSEYQKNGIVDAWWDAGVESTPAMILKALHTTAPRFARQKGLAKRVLGCKESTAHARMVTAVRSLSRTRSTVLRRFKYQPKKLQAGIAQHWYCAAEVVLLEYEPQLISAKYVALLAVDASRVEQLNAA